MKKIRKKIFLSGLYKMWMDTELTFKQIFGKKILQIKKYKFSYSQMIKLEIKMFENFALLKLNLNPHKLQHFNRKPFRLKLAALNESNTRTQQIVSKVRWAVILLNTNLCALLQLMCCSSSKQINMFVHVYFLVRWRKNW